MSNISIGYYVLIHLLFSLMATTSYLRRIEDGKISDKLKEKIARTQITFLQIANGNAEKAQALFIGSLFLSNFFLFSYLFRIVNLFKKPKK